MSPKNEDRQITVKLSELFIKRLDALAKNGSLNRHQLMLTLVTLWLKVLDETGFATLFDLALLLREKIRAVRDLIETPWEYAESHFQEKSIPIKLPDSSILKITCLVSKTRMTRHQIMKNMIVVGMEELENISLNKPYDYADVEPKLVKQLNETMNMASKLMRIALK